jgi:ATPase related to the helicase subunit of the Holliday junction resolvase
MDLFSQNLTANRKKNAPLADRMRPTALDDFIGQQHIVGPGKLLRRAIQTDSLTSSIFFGPPGCGKTTLASIIAQSTHADFAKLNAVTAGVKDVRAVIEKAEDQLAFHGRSTYLLLDECHRWNKSQSDSILPALENGVIRFIGSTTENPMISMTSAIVSRCRLFQFYPLHQSDVETALLRALHDEVNGYGKLRIALEDDARTLLAHTANGDVRIALNALELAVLTTPADTDGIITITPEIAAESIQRKVMVCDDEQFYNMLSAFCKSLRGSDADAALAWFGRLVYAGVDPRIIVRRIIAHASEDVGMANPTAMQQAVAAGQALEMIGMPEARLSIAQAIVYLCESPKSNAIVAAVDAAFADAEHSRDEPVPLHLRDTSYRGADQLGNGAEYKYPHDYPGHYLPQQYMPPSAQGKRYYVPSEQGQEAKIAEAQKHRPRWNPAMKKSTLEPKPTPKNTTDGGSDEDEKTSK